MSLPLHERICRWINQHYVPTQSATITLELTTHAICNITALEHVVNDFPVGDGFVYKGYQPYPCDEVSTFISYVENKPLYRSGALLFTFSDANGENSFDVLAVAGYLNDESMMDLIQISAIPEAHLQHWLTFEAEVSRIARSAIPHRERVFIIGGTEVSFDATVDWDDIHLPQEIKQNILEDVDSFFEKGVSIYQRLKINPFRKLLFAGVPGTGKTMLCSALAKWAQSKGYFVVYVSGSNQYGAQFWKIHQALEMAASSDAPTIVIVEELDAYLDDDSKAQLLNVLDGSETPQNQKGTVMIATTNHPEIIDNRVMKRPGRLDRIFIIPELENAEDAEQMLRAYLGDVWHEDHSNIVPELLGKPGAFIREVALHALTMAAYQQMDGLPLDVLQGSLDSLVKQIEAKDDFLTNRKRGSMDFAQSIERNGRRRS